MMDTTLQESPTKWSETTLETFIEIYQKHPCLWNFNDSNFTSQFARKVALQKILVVMSIPGLTLPELKRKIHSIRNTYTNIRRKIERGGYKPRSRWFYMADKFLRKIVNSRKDRLFGLPADDTPVFEQVSADSLQNLLQTVSSAEVPDSPEIEYDVAGSLYDGSRGTIAWHNEPTILVTGTGNQARETKASSSQQPNQQTIRIVTPASLLARTSSVTPHVQVKEEVVEEETMEELTDQSTDVMSFDEKEDELEAFARSIVIQMRRLPEEYNIGLMMEIQRLVSEKRIEYLWSQKGNNTSQGEQNR